MALVIKLCIVALVTGETVSLVDVDISQRGRNSPHPPTPPAPPRRSLSLLGETHYRCSHTICFTLSKYVPIPCGILPLSFAPTPPASESVCAQSLNANVQKFGVGTFFLKIILI